MRVAPVAVMIACASPVAPPREAPTAIASAPAAAERAWRPIATPAPFAAGQPLLLTDGTVMIQELGTERWWRLAPDATGSYELGTWSQLASAPPGYSPLYDASAVLPDGRVIVMGGEYIAGQQAFSDIGAIYDPLADRWTGLNAPDGWGMIGDASGIVQPNGRFLLSSCCSTQTAQLDPVTLFWTETGSTTKLDINDEESWVLLPDGTILTIDANNAADPTHAERYDPATQTWSSAGEIPIAIVDGPSHEVGPNVLRYDGTVVGFGGNAHNVIYDTATGAWSQGPDFPVDGSGAQLDMGDAPAAVLPNGDVLVATSPGIFNPPVHFFELHGSTFTEVAAPPHAATNTSYDNFFLVLPTGEILLADFTTDVELYTPAAGVVAAAQPVITAAPIALDGTSTAAAPPAVATLEAGHSYELDGLRMSGLTQGAYYGDDNQSSTNYPLVRLEYQGSGHVAYCRTHDHSGVSIAPDARARTRFDVPATAEVGLASLVVVANGIASPPVLVNVR